MSLRSRLRKFGRRIKRGFKRAAKGVARAVRGIGSAIVSIFRGIIQFFGNLFQGDIAGAFRSLWRGIFTQGIARAVRALLSGLIDVVEGLLGVVTSIFGEKIHDYLSAGLADILRSVLIGVWDAAAGILENVFERVGDIIVGTAEIFRGNFRRGARLFFMAPVKTFESLFEFAVLVLGKILSAIQTLITVEPAGRQLEPEEQRFLERIYGESIDYDVIRIKEGKAGLLSLNDRPFVLGNTIYMKNNVWDTDCAALGTLAVQATSGTSTDCHIYYATLVHEVCHVWQLQNGGTDYLAEALWWQTLRDDAYDWSRSIPDTPWSELEPEQQAQFLEEAVGNAGFHPAAPPPPANLAFFDTASPCYERFDGPNCRSGGAPTALDQYLTEALSDVRAGRGAP